MWENWGPCMCQMFSRFLFSLLILSDKRCLWQLYWRNTNQLFMYCYFVSCAVTLYLLPLGVKCFHFCHSRLPCSNTLCLFWMNHSINSLIYSNLLAMVVICALFLNICCVHTLHNSNICPVVFTDIAIFLVT